MDINNWSKNKTITVTTQILDAVKTDATMRYVDAIRKPLFFNTPWSTKKWFHCKETNPISKKRKSEMLHELDEKILDNLKNKGWVWVLVESEGMSQSAMNKTMANNKNITNAEGLFVFNNFISILKWLFYFCK